MLLGLRALATSLVLSLAAVIFCRPFLQPDSDELIDGELGPSVLGDRFDESSLMQVSQAVQRHVIDSQRKHHATDTSKNPAGELPAVHQSVDASPMGHVNLFALQLGFQRRVGSIEKRKVDAFMAVTILFFGSCVLLLMLFPVFPDSWDEVTTRASFKPTGETPLYPEQLGMHYQHSQDLGCPSLMRMPSPSVPVSLRPSSRLPSGHFLDSSKTLPEARPSEPLSPQTTPNLISPQLVAVVPERRKFILKIPSLLEHLPLQAEISKIYAVQTQDAIEMFNLKVVRHQSQEYLSLCMPSDVNQVLVFCSFYRTLGHTLTCEVYKSASMGEGRKLYGVLQEQPARTTAGGVVESFAFLSAARPSEKLLSIVVAGKIAERRVRIFDGRDPSFEVAKTVPNSATAEVYEVECYPHSDVMLVVLALAAADRIVSLSRSTTSFGG